MSLDIDFTQENVVQFLEGQSLKTSLMLLPFYATNEVFIMVPYLGRSQLLSSILNIPETIKVNVFTRDKKGYLPNIKNEADPTISKLKNKKNVNLFIDNKIHAKVWKIDNKIAVVHSMNGTFHSENHNFEAGILTNNKIIIDEIKIFFEKAEKEAKKLS
ncbi:MAG: phospholipase D-like domain-containing protein [Candidatus Hodarchaeales archaeon]|jgi:phosphatidylserine/phosphatidylglycerophosphate/cardiolipin synthase-like enzyme